MIWLAIAFISIFAGVLSGIVGTGSSLILLPILVFAFGAKSAVPIMAIAAVLANLGRLLVWWVEIRWRPVIYYSITSIPAAAFGAMTLISMPETMGNIVLGFLFFGLIPARRFLKAYNIGRYPIHLAIAGAAIGFLTGIVASSGPLSLAVFSAFGLAKSALIASEAAASFFVYGSKISMFDQLGAVQGEIVIRGCIVGAGLIAGTFLAKHLLRRISHTKHESIIDVVLGLAGLSLVLS